MALDTVRVNEGSTRVVEFDILDEDLAAVPSGALTGGTLTLLDVETYVPGGSPVVGIINARDDQTVLNANDVTINSSGHVTWQMQPEDNPIVTPRRQIERHRAMFHFEWSDGAFNFECEIQVVNLRKAV